MPNQNLKRLASPKKLVELFPNAFTESSIRWLLFNKKTNGFIRCVRHVGRKIVIDVDEFETWISEQRGEKS